MLIPCANLASTMSTIRNPSSEGTSFKCPLCNIVHRFTTATVTIGDRTLKVYACREIFGVTAECPICLDECSNLIALPCGHILCKDDYQRMTKVKPTSTDSRRAARRALRSVDAPAAALGFSETSTGGVVPPLASDSSRSSLSSRFATSQTPATTPASIVVPPAETVDSLRESEVARSAMPATPHPSTSTSFDVSSVLLVSVTYVFCLLILVEINDAHALKLAFFLFLYSILLSVIIEGVVRLRFGSLVALELIWAFGTLSLLGAFAVINICSVSDIECLVIVFGVGLSHCIIMFKW